MINDMKIENDHVYITEKVTDCTRLLQEGLSCICSANLKEADSENIVKLLNGKNIVKIIPYKEEYENDLQETIEIVKKLEKAGITVEIIQLTRPSTREWIGLSEYLRYHTFEDFINIPGSKVWDVLLTKQPKPSKSHQKVQIVKQFIENNLMDMDHVQRRVFVFNEVKHYFGMTKDDIKAVLKQIEFINGSGISKYFGFDDEFLPSIMSEDIQKEMTIKTMSDTKEIRVYDEETGCYLEGGEDAVRKKVKDILGSESAQRRGNEVIYDISLATLTERSEFDKEDGCINLQNGYYNIYTHEFFTHASDKLFTKALPFKYDPNATCPYFQKFIDSTGVDSVQLFEIFGYCLVNGYPLQTIIFFVGDGGNGKGTTLRVLTHFLGANNVSGYSIQALSSEKYAMSCLHNKYANICGDMPRATISETSVIKSLTGGDLLPGRNIYGNPFSFVNRAKMIFSMNHVPEIEDHTDSMCRRLVSIEFNNRIKGLEPDFNEDNLVTSEELSGIFNKAMEVLPKLLERGEFTGYRSIEENRQYLQNKADSVSNFVNSCATVGGDYTTLVQDVYTAYTKWCTETKETRVTNSVFGKQIAKKFQEDIFKVQISSERVRKNYYRGIVLNNEYRNLDLEFVEGEYKKVRENGNSKSAIATPTAIGVKSDLSNTIDFNEDNCNSKSTIFNEDEDENCRNKVDACKSKGNEQDQNAIAAIATRITDTENTDKPTIASAVVVENIELKCFDCGNPDAPNISDGKTYRCKTCYNDYQRLKPLKSPDLSEVSI